MLTMFVKVCTLAFLAASVAALQIEPLENAHSQGDVSITWMNEADDVSRFATFSVFLHHPTFRSDFAILNNQRPADGGANVTLPVVPAQDGYTLRATDVGNINNEFAVSAPFSIGPEISSTSSLASSTSSSTLPSGSTPATALGSGTILSVPPTSAFGVTVSSPTASVPPSTSLRASIGSGAGSGTNTAAQGDATNFNGATSVEMKAWALGAAVMGLGWLIGGD